MKQTFSQIIHIILVLYFLVGSRGKITTGGIIWGKSPSGDLHFKGVFVLVIGTESLKVGYKILVYPKNRSMTILEIFSLSITLKWSQKPYC